METARERLGHTRIIMIGTITGLQWWIYDTFKSAVGLGVGQGKKH